MQLLLSPQLRSRLAWVEDAELKGVVALLQQMRNVCLEGQVGALVLGHLASVDVGGAGIVDTVEVQDAAAPRRKLRPSEGAAVPKELAWLQLALDPRKRSLG